MATSGLCVHRVQSYTKRIQAMFSHIFPFRFLTRTVYAFFISSLKIKVITQYNIK